MYSESRSKQFNSVIIAGERADKETGLIYGNTVDEIAIILQMAIWESNFPITEVVSGGASGVDAAGERWAKTHNIPIKSFPADWTQGKMAGFIRNRQMAQYAHALIALWDGKSPGTHNMIKEANKEGLAIHIHFL